MHYRALVLDTLNMKMFTLIKISIKKVDAVREYLFYFFRLHELTPNFVK